MKILAIRGENIASLNNFEIDFTKEPLLSAGIFAITGPTGSGKSSILDAMCLALYNKAPRLTNVSQDNKMQENKIEITAQNVANILNRDSASAFAEVDFEIHNKKYRSRWSIRRARNSVTKNIQAPEILLTNLDDNTNEQGKITEILKKIQELIGLSFEQFTRALLLAQGDFATFLKASTKDKAELLEKLTGTEIYSEISRKIFQKYSEENKEIETIQKLIDTIEIPDIEIQEKYKNEKQEIEKNKNIISQEIKIIETKLKWLDDKDKLEKNLAEAKNNLKTCEIEIKKLIENENILEKIDKIQEIKEDYNNNITIEKELIKDKETIKNDKKEIKDKEENFQKIEKSLLEIRKDFDNFKSDFQEIRGEIEKARILDTNIKNEEQQQQEIKTEYLSLENKINEINKEIITTKEKKQKAEEQLKELLEYFEDNKTYKNIILKISLINDYFEKRKTEIHKQNDNNNKLEEIKKHIISSKTDLNLQEEEAKRLNNILPNEIFILRQKLKDGEACPVCGSIHHKVNNAENDNIDFKELERAKKENAQKIENLKSCIDKYQKEKIKLDTQINENKNNINEIINKLEENLKEIPNWQNDLENNVLQTKIIGIAEKWIKNTELQNTVNQNIRTYETKIKEKEEIFLGLKNDIEKKTQKSEEIKNSLEKLLDSRQKIIDGKDANIIEEKYNNKQKEFENKSKEIEDNYNKLSQEIALLKGKIEQLAEIINKNEIKYKTIKNSVEKWFLENKDFTEEQVKILLTKDNKWVKTEREKIKNIKDKQRELQTLVAERTENFKNHNLAEIKASEEENYNNLKLQQTIKNDLQEKNTEKEKQIYAFFENLKNNKNKQQELKKEKEKRRKKLEPWAKLNEVFGSSDGSKFKKLAQKFTLETLLQNANEYLKQLSDRYQLKQTGTLDSFSLLVVDSYMLNEERLINTLSGGETFLLSLALALGLSSISSSNLIIESLFIDEGFGSLDNDTLNTAMKTLEDLNAKGRKIGVISHVAEMNERITTKINVQKQGNGRSNVNIIKN